MWRSIVVHIRRGGQLIKMGSSESSMIQTTRDERTLGGHYCALTLFHETLRAYRPLGVLGYM